MQNLMMHKRKTVYVVLQKNAFVLLTYALVCMLTFSLILPFLCQNLVYSFFYIHSQDSNDIKNLAIKQNEERAIKAEGYFTRKHGRLKPSINPFEGDQVDIAIAVVSVRRTDPHQKLGYLTQTMAQLDRLYRTGREFRRKAVFICNVEPVASQHVEANQMSLFFPIKHRQQRAPSVHEKEKLDYTFCLEEAMKYNPRYVLVLEDDFLPRDNFFTILSTVLNHHLKISLERNSLRDENWAFLKLYYPERWQGYANETSCILELAGVGCVGGVFFLLFHLICRQSHASPVWECYFMFALGALYLVLVALLVGRQYVLKLKHASTDLYTLKPAPDCCTPAVVYPARQVAPLLNYLRNVSCSSAYPFDFALDDFAKGHKLKRYLIEPNLGRHIGMRSSLTGNDKVNPGQFLF